VLWQEWVVKVRNTKSRRIIAGVIFSVRLAATIHLTSPPCDLADLIPPVHVRRIEQEEREAKQEKQAKKEELENKHTKDVVHRATTQHA
jgi:hypothetical protein